MKTIFVTTRLIVEDDVDVEELASCTLHTLMQEGVQKAEVVDVLKVEKAQLELAFA